MSLSLATLGLPPSAAPGLCVLADPGVAWLHLLSDVAIGLAYLSIPAVLVVVLLRRRDLAYPWLVGLFAAFIVCCGATHLLHAYAMLWPIPVLEGLMKALTAAVSVAVAVVLWPVLPRLLALRSPAALAREVEVRRAAEMRAVESEARTAAFIANLAEALFVVRVEAGGAMVVETVNPAFERLFGVTAASVIGRPAAEALPRVLRELALPRWRAAVERGDTESYELTGELPVGRRSWQTVLVPMRGADGRVERLLGSARDVTDTRRLQAGLVQSARLATVGTMCAGLAHEASQPLNAAALWLRRGRAALRAFSTEQQGPLLQAFAVVEDQLRRAGELVARMRALAGEEPRVPARFDAVQAVGAALRVAGTQFAPDGVELQREGEEGRVLVQGSAARLEQAVLHLLANARDAVLERRRQDPAAPARITVLLRREPSHLAIEVRDSGPGVDPALADAIFDPFFTTKEPGRGIGLGLPFAAGVARAMGGSLDAWNLAEGGACFRLEVGLADGPAERLSGAAGAVAA